MDFLDVILKADFAMTHCFPEDSPPELDLDKLGGRSPPLLHHLHGGATCQDWAHHHKVGDGSTPAGRRVPLLRSDG